MVVLPFGRSDMPLPTVAIRLVMVTQLSSEIGVSLCKMIPSVLKIGSSSSHLRALYHVRLVPEYLLLFHL